MPSDSDSGDSIDWDSLKSNTSFDTEPPAPSADSTATANNSTTTNTNGSSSTPTSAATVTASATATRQLVTNIASNSFIDHITHNASTPVSLLVESLVQQLCSMLDSDPQRSSALYLRICEQLHQMRLIDGTYAMGEFELMRSQYQRALYQLVTVARGQELPLPVQSVWPLTQPVGMDWSRYHREFDELAFVAGGGFGKVFKARHRLDGIEYAVKKVTIRSVTIGRILSHLAEVRTLAGLNHQNVVAYKAAWLEPLLEDPASRGRALEGADGEEEEEEEDEEDDEDESNFTASVTRGSQFSSVAQSVSASVAIEDTADEDDESFIQFETSHQSVSRTSASVSIQMETSHSISKSSQQRAPQQQLSVFNDQQPHLNLKWATLYIQMTLCQQTLREWLDARNQQSQDFQRFYAEFRSQNPDDSSSAGVAEEEFEEDDSHSFAAVAHEIFVQLSTGLEYIHSRGIIHHDIKPSNVFIGWQAGKLSVQLGDFGLACPLQEEHSSANLVGTPTYAAPEQLRGCCDPKSDVFSLGVVLAELLMVFGTDMERIRTVEVVRRAEVPEGFPPVYAELLKRLVAKEPKDRPTVASVLARLAAIQKEASVLAAQEQVDELTRELERLRTEMAQTQERKKDQQEQHQQRGDSPSLRARLSSKDDEIRAKNNEIHRLHRQLILMRRSAVEMRSKDAEIRRLKGGTAAEEQPER